MSCSSGTPSLCSIAFGRNEFLDLLLARISERKHPAIDIPGRDREEIRRCAIDVTLNVDDINARNASSLLLEVNAQALRPVAPDTLRGDVHRYLHQLKYPNRPCQNTHDVAAHARPPVHSLDSYGPTFSNAHYRGEPYVSGRILGYHAPGARTGRQTGQ